MPPTHSPGRGEMTPIPPPCISTTLSLGAVLGGKKTQAATAVAGAPVARDDLSQRAPSQGFSHFINLPSSAAWTTERQPRREAGSVQLRTLSQQRSRVWGCQHFQARDNSALFPCHIGKIINIPWVCFQAALWNKSQTVVVSPGSLVPQNCLFSLHESPTPALPLPAPPKPRVVAQGLIHVRWAVDTQSRATPELRWAPASVGIDEPPWTSLPAASSSPGSPWDHLVLWTWVFLPGS